MKRLVSLVAILALIPCFGRVVALAAAPDEAHACCQGEAPQAPEPSELTECCPVPAVATFSAPKADLPFVAVVEAACFAAPSVAREIETNAQAPPGPLACLSAVPSRAPPLA